MRGAAYRLDRYERGLCVRCGNLRREGYSNCQQCADDDKQRFDGQVAAGLCRQCKEPRELLSKVKCESCNKNARLSRLRKLGLPEEEISKASVALDKHRGFCDSCGVSEPGGRGEWCLDHDEELKRFRGIICNACNSAIGHALDNPERLRAAAVYLEEKQR